MAKIDHPFGFTGRIDRLSFYNRALSDKTIVRKAMGISTKRFKTDPAFIGARRQSAEFSGRTLLAKAIYGPMRETIRPVFDNLFFNVIMSKVTEIQKMDRSNPSGTRNIEVSKYKDSFNGLSFNNDLDWEQVIGKPLDIVVNREDSKLNISIPSLSSSDGFTNKPGLPFCRFWFLLSVIPDAIKGPGHYELTTSEHFSKWDSTPWLDCNQEIPETELSISIPQIEDVHTLLLSSAICFGKKVNGKIEVVNYVGAGRVETVL